MDKIKVERMNECMTRHVWRHFSILDSSLDSKLQPSVRGDVLVKMFYLIKWCNSETQQGLTTIIDRNLFQGYNIDIRYFLRIYAM